ALLLIASESAKGFGLIPTTTDVKGAVKWAWDRFQKSSDATALDPETQTLGNLQGWIAERWNVTIKDVDIEGGINNREATGWFDARTIYIPKDRIREAAGNTLKESHIGSLLNQKGLLTSRSGKDRFTIKWVPKIGGVVC